MKNYLKRKIKGVFRKLGFNINTLNHDEFGYNINDEVIRILKSTSPGKQNPLILDVGSNIGQSIEFYKYHFPQSIIHAFEPGTVFKQLKEKTSHFSGIQYNNVGVGAKKGEAVFINNTSSDVSSFLEPTGQMWGDVVSRTSVHLITIDDYIKDNSISDIDFLKIDTQGFDFEVLKGADKAMKDGKIKLVQLEITLSKLYENLPSMDEIIAFLFQRGYKLVAFYGFHNKRFASQWTDGLFIHQSLTK